MCVVSSLSNGMSELVVWWWLMALRLPTPYETKILGYWWAYILSASHLSWAVTTVVMGVRWLRKQTHYLVYYTRPDLSNKPSFREVIYFLKFVFFYEMIKRSITLYMIHFFLIWVKTKGEIWSNLTYLNLT